MKENEKLKMKTPLNWKSGALLRKGVCAIGAALVAGAIAAAFTAGRISSACAGREGCGPEAPAVSCGDAAKLAKAERRIAVLERKLAAAREKLRPGTADSVPAADGGVSVVGGTNVDIIAELKKNLSGEDFDRTTNAMSRIKAKMAAKAQDRMAFLKSIDTSMMSQAEREGHEKFLELTAKREAVRSKMKFGLPDRQTIQEMIELEMQLKPLAKAERAALSRELARELGYTGEDVESLQEAVGNIFDCTAGGFGLDGMMDAAEGMPGVEIGTDVQVLTL